MLAQRATPSVDGVTPAPIRETVFGVGASSSPENVSGNSLTGLVPPPTRDTVQVESTKELYLQLVGKMPSGKEKLKPLEGSWKGGSEFCGALCCELCSGEDRLKVGEITEFPEDPQIEAVVAALRDTDKDIADDLKDILEAQDSGVVSCYAMTWVDPRGNGHVVISNLGDASAFLLFHDESDETICQRLTYCHQANTVREINRILADAKAKNQVAMITKNCFGATNIKYIRFFEQTDLIIKDAVNQGFIPLTYEEANRPLLNKAGDSIPVDVRLLSGKSGVIQPTRTYGDVGAKENGSSSQSDIIHIEIPAAQVDSSCVVVGSDGVFGRGIVGDEQLRQIKIDLDKTGGESKDYCKNLTQETFKISYKRDARQDDKTIAVLRFKPKATLYAHVLDGHAGKGKDGHDHCLAILKYVHDHHLALVYRHYREHAFKQMDLLTSSVAFHGADHKLASEKKESSEAGFETGHSSNIPLGKGSAT
jgi:hypothetical protein